MAQTGYTPISIYYSATATNVPTAGNLVAGELAINTADGKLFYKDSAGVVQTIAGKGGAGVAGGSTTQVQYNSSGSLAGSANMTFSGTALTLANDASISGLTVGKGTGSIATNTVVGNGALRTNTTGALNAIFGLGAGDSITTGSNNSYFGGYAGAQVASSTGSSNSGFGYFTLAGITSGANNTAVGQDSLRSNTTASDNVAVGYQALYSTVTGNACTAVGTGALYSNTAAENSAFGRNALTTNTTGTNNTALGQASLNNNTTGNYNAAGGRASLLSNTTGASNTAFGTDALRLNTTGSSNVGVGYQALYSKTTGTDNTALGYQAGYALTTGSANVYIGSTCTPSSATVINEVVIGNSGAVGKGASTGFIYPNAGGVYQGNNSATWSITSDARLKKNIVNNNTGLGLISQIQIRNFEYRLPEEITELPQNQAIAKTGVQLGVIAQEIAEVSQEFVKTESTGVMSVDSDNLTWYLINAVKELNAKITALENK
jgi:hypothetical protein